MRVELVDKLDAAFQELKGMEETPSEVDDTLIERLVASINVNEPSLLPYLLSLLESNEVLEMGEVALGMLLRIAEQIVNSSTVPPDQIARLVSRIPTVLFADSSTVQDAAMGVAVAVRKRHQCDWTDVNKWLMATFPACNISLYVRQKAVAFFQLETDPNFIKDLVTLCMKHVCDCLRRDVHMGMCGVLEHFNGYLSTEDKRKLWKYARGAMSQPYPFIVLMARIAESSMDANLANSEEWRDKVLRRKIMVEVGRRTEDRLFVEEILKEPVTLRLLSDIIPFLNEKEASELIDKWIATDLTKISGEDLKIVLNQMGESGFSFQSMCPLLYAYLPKCERDPSPIIITLDKIANWAGQQPKLAAAIKAFVDERIKSNQWEPKDTALQLITVLPNDMIPSSLPSLLSTLAFSDSSFYVRRQALLTLYKLRPQEALELAVKILVKMGGAEEEEEEDDEEFPTEDAATILIEAGSKQQREAVVDILLAPDSVCDQENGLRIVEKLLKESKGQEADKWKGYLRERLDDDDLQEEARRILRESRTVKDKDVDLLEELIHCARIRSDDKDCY